MYSHHFRHGVFGSGLLTLSAFPILEASFSAFAAAGDPLAVLQGDGVAGKGVGCVALDLSSSSGGGIVGDGRGRSGRRLLCRWRGNYLFPLSAASAAARITAPDAAPSSSFFYS